MEEPGQHVLLFARRAETIEERVLRRVLHHPVRARDQELGRQRDRRGVGDDPRGRVVEAEQDVDGNGARQQRIGVVGRDALRIVRQELRLDVARDEEIAAERPHQAQARQRERHVELHLERRRGEDEAADARGVVVSPRRDDDRADTLRDDGDRLGREAVARSDVVDERLHIAHRRAETRRMAARPRRTAVPARIPGEEIEIGQVELGGQVGHAARVLVAAVEDHDRAARRARGRRPVAIEERHVVVRLERVLGRRPRAADGERLGRRREPIVHRGELRRGRRRPGARGRRCCSRSAPAVSASATRRAREARRRDPRRGPARRTRARDRSCPSARRSAAAAPTIGPSAPAISDTHDATMTAPTDQGPNGATKANGR